MRANSFRRDQRYVAAVLTTGGKLPYKTKRFLVERDENVRWHFCRNHHASKNKRIRTWGIATQKSQFLFICLSPIIPKILSPFIGANLTITRSLPTGKLRRLPCQLASGITHFWTTQINYACVVMSVCLFLSISVSN